MQHEQRNAPCLRDAEDIAHQTDGQKHIPWQVAVGEFGGFGGKDYFAFEAMHRADALITTRARNGGYHDTILHGASA